MKIKRKLISTILVIVSLCMALCSIPAFASGNTGDLNKDGSIDALDASLILSAYAVGAINNGDNGLSYSDILIADVNNDGNVDALDASLILGYYAYIATGGHMTLPAYIKNPPAPKPVATKPVQVTPVQPATNSPVVVPTNNDVGVDNDKSRIVYITETGKKYHYENPCGRGTYYPITLGEAEAKGLEPCGKCVLH